MRRFNKTTAIAYVLFLLFLPTLDAAGAELQCGSDFSVGQCVTALPNYFGLPSIAAVNVIDKITTFILSLSVALAVLAIVIGGIMYITSFGDEAKTARAKKVLLYAILGLMVTGLAGVIVIFVGDLF